MLAGNYFASGKGGEAFVFLRVLSPCFFFSLFFLSIFFFFFWFGMGYSAHSGSLGLRPWGCGGQIVAHLQMASRIITRMFAVAPG